MSPNFLTVCSLGEIFGVDGSLGRETKGEAVLIQLLRTALCKFNPEAITNPIDALTRDLLWSHLLSGQISVDSSAH